MDKIQTKMQVSFNRFYKNLLSSVQLLLQVWKEMRWIASMQSQQTSAGTLDKQASLRYTNNTVPERCYKT